MRLNLGCGDDLRKDWVNVDCRDLPGVDLVADAADLNMLVDGSVGKILAHDLLEHFPQERTTDILLEWFRVLESDGILIIRTPDLRLLMKFLQTGKWSPQTISRKLFGAQDYPENRHCLCFTREWLKGLCTAAGFRVESEDTITSNMILVLRKP